MDPLTVLVILLILAVLAGAGSGVNSGPTGDPAMEAPPPKET